MLTSDTFDADGWNYSFDVTGNTSIEDWMNNGGTINFEGEVTMEMGSTTMVIMKMI